MPPRAPSRKAQLDSREAHSSTLIGAPLRMQRERALRTIAGVRIVSRLALARVTAGSVDRAHMNRHLMRRFTASAAAHRLARRLRIDAMVEHHTDLIVARPGDPAADIADPRKVTTTRSPARKRSSQSAISPVSDRLRTRARGRATGLPHRPARRAGTDYRAWRCGTRRSAGRRFGRLVTARSDQMWPCAFIARQV